MKPIFGPLPQISQTGPPGNLTLILAIFKSYQKLNLFSMLLGLWQNPLFTLALIIGLILAITIHEFCHAFSAHLLGDDTAKREGRLTLNPLAHLDFLGTLMLLIFHFGWGKPVPINPANFKNQRLGNALTAIAGPGSNLILAIILGLILRLMPQAWAGLWAVLAVLVYVNLILLVFNLIPVPPLDGSRLLYLILPSSVLNELENYGAIILIAFLFVAYTGAIPVFDWLSYATGYLFTLIVGTPII